MEDVIDFVLRKNAGHMTAGTGALCGETPLETLMREEGGAEDGDEWKVRGEAFWRMLEYLYEEGPEPLALIRRIYALTKAIAPHLLGDMSMDDIAMLSGDGGRATVSARILRIYNGKLAEAGMKGVKSACQKSDEARETYRGAQMGNRNRTKNKGRRRRPPTKKTK